MASVETTFTVGMTCEGCSGAVTRILTKLDGVEKVECDIEQKKVKVVHAPSVDKKVMLDKLKKWGEAAQKEVSDEVA
eukprot:CAMPEP_0197895754 /NCGR_PEP_ID=MMETSP1439-20131203/38084_1 /TAXON_ID=66791 /ORGANISM="Gonyaulax spinifera, Strain CCMP409" /LENGTH=76 /DNA_ID=CAMNT_0043516215 /DNA_START=51 /DNA_END=281 /DNA_ORIENTATION=+